MLDFVSWASTGDSDKEHWIWILIDVFNLLITAILIFLIFICKRNIIAQLERKCRVFEGKYDLKLEISVLIPMLND